MKQYDNILTLAGKVLYSLLIYSCIATLFYTNDFVFNTTNYMLENFCILDYILNTCWIGIVFMTMFSTLAGKVLYFHYCILDYNINTCWKDIVFLRIVILTMFSTQAGKVLYFQ